MIDSSTIKLAVKQAQALKAFTQQVLAGTIVLPANLPSVTPSSVPIPGTLIIGQKVVYVSYDPVANTYSLVPNQSEQ